MNNIVKKQVKQHSSAKKIGGLLMQELKNDPHFYFFSPDETTSNKFDQVFEVEKELGVYQPTKRICQKAQTGESLKCFLKMSYFP